MKIDIIQKRENSLLKRTEYRAKVTFQGATPSNGDLKKHFAKTASAAEDVTVIRKISTEFGASKAVVDALVYSDATSLKNYEAPEKKKEAKNPVEEKAE